MDNICPICGQETGFGLAYLHQECICKTYKPSGRTQWDRIRKKVSPKIQARDGHKCVKCGSTENLVIDHIVPITKGGNNDESNLRTLCWSCNIKRKRVGWNENEY